MLEIRPLHLPPYNAKLVPKQKQFGFRVANTQPYIDNIEKQLKARVEKSEQHRDRDPTRTPNLLRVANPPTKTR